MLSFIFKRKKHENKPFRSNMSMSERQREWNRKCEREAQKAREEGLSREEVNKIVYYKKEQPKTTCKTVQKRSPSNAVAPKKKRWKGMTESERRRQVRERDAQLIKDYKDTERKLKNAAKKGGKAVYHAVEGLGIVANKVADVEVKGIKKAAKQKPFVKKMVKDVGKAGQKALDGISRMVDNHDRYYAKREREARKATRKITRKATTKKATVRKATTKKVTVRKATAKPKTAKRRVVKRRK